MSTGLENEINKLLNVLPSQTQVADEMLKKWHRSVLSHREIDEVAQLLFKMGLHRSLWSEVMIQSEKKAYLPVDVCFQIINLYAENLPLDEEWINSLFLWAESSGTTKTLIRCDQLLAKDRRLQKLRELSIDTDLGHRFRDLQVNERSLMALVKDELWPEASILAKRVLVEFPENSVALGALEKIQYQIAVKTIRKQNQNSKRWAGETNALSSQKTDESDKTQNNAVTTGLSDLAKSKPSWSYDLAVALFSLGATEQALELLEQQKEPSDFRAHMLKLEILSEQRKFHLVVELIEGYLHAQSIDESAEQRIALNYILAKSLWSAGEKVKASELMLEIVNSRPQYRISEYLLREWNQELSQ